MRLPQRPAEDLPLHRTLLHKLERMPAKVVVIDAERQAFDAEGGDVDLTGMPSPAARTGLVKQWPEVRRLNDPHRAPGVVEKCGQLVEWQRRLRELSMRLAVEEHAQELVAIARGTGQEPCRDSRIRLGQRRLRCDGAELAPRPSAPTGVDLRTARPWSRSDSCREAANDATSARSIRRARPPAILLRPAANI